MMNIQISFNNSNKTIKIKKLMNPLILINTLIIIKYKFVVITVCHLPNKTNMS